RAVARLVDVVGLELAAHVGQDDVGEARALALAAVQAPGGADPDLAVGQLDDHTHALPIQPLGLAQLAHPPRARVETAQVGARAVVTAHPDTPGGVGHEPPYEVGAQAGVVLREPGGAAAGHAHQARVGRADPHRAVGRPRDRDARAAREHFARHAG